MTQIISEGLTRSIDANGTVQTSVRDTDKETARVKWLRDLWMGTTKVDVFMTFGSPDLDAEVAACWGPFAGGESKGRKAPPFKAPYNGQDVPEQYRHYVSAKAVAIASQGKQGASSDVSRDGLAILDYLARSYPEWQTYATPAAYTLKASQSGDATEHVYPAGTVLGTLSPKDLARLCYAVRYNHLPRHLTGADRNKDRGCVHALMGRSVGGTNGGGFVPL